MSEMRRAARRWVEHRSERFESHYPLEESRRRLEAALARLGPAGWARFSPRWTEEGGHAVLHADFAPAPATGRALGIGSITMLLLIVGSAWALWGDAGKHPAAYMIPVVTVLAVLGLPFVVAAFGSQREAAEARILKAIRVALLDEEEFRPRRYDEEE